MAEEKKIAFETVQEHCTKYDCWVIYKGAVYDVTKFADEHPGGAEVVTDLAGQDMTIPFDDIEHSDEAKEELERYRVGVLDGKAPALKAPQTISSVGSSTMGPLFILAVVAIMSWALKYM